MRDKKVVFNGEQGVAITDEFDMLSGRACWVQFDDCKRMCLLDELEIVE